MKPRSYQKPSPLNPARARCPVCQEAVYSRSGIHPQCAVRQADPPRPKAKPPIPGGQAALETAPPVEVAAGVGAADVLPDVEILHATD